MFFCLLVISSTSTLQGDTCRQDELPSWHLEHRAAWSVQTWFPVCGCRGRELWGSGTAALVTSIPSPWSCLLFVKCCDECLVSIGDINQSHSLALLLQNKEFPEKGNPAAGLYNMNVRSCWPNGISNTDFFFLQPGYKQDSNENNTWKTSG